MQSNLNKVVVIPYTKINGEWTVPDQSVYEAWYQMVKEDLVKLVFYNGKVTNEFEFLEACQSERVHTHFVVCEKGLGAIGWLNNFGDNHAYVHWCTFSTLGIQGKLRAIKESLKYWFGFTKNGEPIFDVLIGMFPDDNQKIWDFAVKSGFKVIGTIPKIEWNHYTQKRVGAVYSYIEKEDVKWEG